jgi:magnesium transporter
MTDKFMRLAANMTVEAAMEAVRTSAADLETLNDLYVVDKPHTPTEQLLGVLSLRELVRAPKGAMVGAMMTGETIAVTVDTDQEEVARLISKYDLLNIPVLDRGNYLAGIVTVDDVIDVMVEEFNEDYMRLAGTDADAMDRRSPAQIARLRLPWLMGTMLIELVAAIVIAHHSEVLRQVVLLAAFMPAISAVSGNVGLQVAAMVVRGFDTGHINFGNWKKFLGKEMVTSLLMALACGLLLGIVGAVWDRHWLFGVVVGGALASSMLTAALMGSLFPVVSKRLGLDPATTAGPFETAFQDVIGYSVFLWLASMLLPWLR